MESNKKRKNIIGITQSGLILVLVVLIVFMMVQINRLQGTARVINYAGLVRGATQREVKLEITGNQNEELVQYLDDILSGLRYQDGHYDLIKLHDKEYQDKLQVQSDYWEKLKIEIEAVRSRGYENTDIVNMSEIYFEMADETVFAAENYSEYRKKILIFPNIHSESAAYPDILCHGSLPDHIVLPDILSHSEYHPDILSIHPSGFL